MPYVTLSICVDPPDKDLISELRQEDGKLYINMSMKVYPLPKCKIIHEVCLIDLSMHI